MALDTMLIRRAAPAPSVVALLGLAILINYVDRGNLATAAPLIKDELHLTGTQIGLLLSAFFWSYTPAQILAGWLGERINAYRTLALGLAVWSLATVASGLVDGFVALLLLRILLGLGESAAFPCSSKLLAQLLPHDKLGAANGLILVGLGLGPAFGTFVGGLLMNSLGWRWVFVLFGIVSLFWLVPWLMATRQASAEESARANPDAPGYAAILARREAWGAGVGHFSNNYALYFVLSWLPLYLVKVRGLSVEHMAEIGGMICVVYALSTALTGWLADRAITAGVSVTLVRKAGVVASLALVAPSFVAAAFGNTEIAIASLFCAGMAMGMGTPSVFAIAQTLSGPEAAGKWMGFQNCMGNVAGILAPLVTGMVVDATGSFFWAFLLAGAFSLLGIAGWTLMIGEVEPLEWARV